MEFVDGVLVARAHAIAGRFLDAFQRIAAQCVEGLAAAHTSRILHGDLKPANIMSTRAGDVKLCDFGLARRLRRIDGYGDSSTTAPRGIVGTPAYMAPEAVFGDELSNVRTSFLGVVLVRDARRPQPVPRPKCNVDDSQQRPVGHDPS
jgi:serine/threonine-protein kinase